MSTDEAYVGTYKWAGAVAIGDTLYATPDNAQGVLTVSATGELGLISTLAVAQPPRAFAGSMAVVGTVLYAVPASAPGVLRVETAGGAVKIIPVDLPAVAEEEKWNGAVAVGTMVYGAPSNAYDILVLDTSTEEVTGVSLLTFGSIHAPLKFAGAAAVDGVVYFAPRKVEKVLAYNTTSGEIIALDIGHVGYGFWGVAAAGPRVYFAPHGSPKILVVDNSLVAKKETAAWALPLPAGCSGVGSAPTLYAGVAVDAGGMVYFSPAASTCIVQVDDTLQARWGYSLRPDAIYKTVLPEPYDGPGLGWAGVAAVGGEVIAVPSQAFYTLSLAATESATAAGLAPPNYDFSIGFTDLGEGKCVNHQGLDPSDYKYFTVGEAECEQLCNATAKPRCRLCYAGSDPETCYGYSATVDACILFLSPVQGGGVAWGGSHCLQRDYDAGCGADVSCGAGAAFTAAGLQETSVDVLFDAVLAIATATTTLKSQGIAEDNVRGMVLADALAAVQLQGTTGLVEFDAATGRRFDRVKLHKAEQGVLQPLGAWTVAGGATNLTGGSLEAALPTLPIPTLPPLPVPPVIPDCSGTVRLAGAQVPIALASGTTRDVACPATFTGKAVVSCKLGAAAVVNDGCLPVPGGNVCNAFASACPPCPDPPCEACHLCS